MSTSPPEVNVYIELEPDLELGFEPAILDEAITRAVQLVGGCRKGSAARLADEIDVSLLITTDDRVRELNRDYRNVDQPTDVLSFSQQEGGPTFVQPPSLVASLGDIVISLETARRQAAGQGNSIEREMAHLALHGTLHLLGYDHETDEEEAEMNGLESQILQALGAS